MISNIENIIATAGTEAAQAVAENESAITETLQAIVNFLPWPWNAVAGGLITAGSAFAMWKTRRAGKELKKD